MRSDRQWLLVVWVAAFALCAAGSCAQLADAYALQETKQDMPTGWEPWPRIAYDNSRAESATFSDHRWMGSRVDENEPVSPSNKIRSDALVTVLLLPNASRAREHLESLVSPTRVAVRPRVGSFSGQAVGDVCFRGGTEDRSAVLWFARANAVIRVNVGGPPGDHDYPALAERIARAMDARALASLALNQVTVQARSGARSPQVRRPNGVPVVLVDEWAAANGATWSADWAEGLATVRRGNRTLKLLVGHGTAWLDGQRIALPFLALRHGKDRVWCPVAALNRLR